MSEQDEEWDELDHATWASALRGGRLLGQECTECGYTTATPKAGCVRCGGLDLEVLELPRSGTVYSESAVSVPPKGFDDEYHVVLVDLNGVETRLLGRSDTPVEIGDVVEFRDYIETEGSPAPVFK